MLFADSQRRGSLLAADATRRVVRVHMGPSERPDSKQTENETEVRKLTKARPKLPTALLALALSLFAASSARAQDSNDARQARDTDARQTRDAAMAQTGAPRKSTGADGGEEQKSPRGAQTADTGPQSNGRAPLTGGEKIGRSFRSAFLHPAPYVTSALTAGITQLGEDRLPNKTGADELADWGSRAARNFATSSTQTLFASGFYPALLRQDPRYDPSTSKSFGRRTLHAASRVFVARHDDGRLEPNYSRFAGVMTASALANLWEHSTPRHDRIGADATLNRFATLLAGDVLTNIVFKEFGPDIVRIFRH